MNNDYRQYVTALGESDFFRNMSEREILRLLEKMNAHVEEYAKGDVIYRYGDEVREMAIVLDGLVNAIVDEDEGEGTVLNVMRVGEEFGAFLLVSGRTRSWMVVSAATRCRIMFMDVRRLSVPSLEDQGEYALMNNMIVSFASKCVDLYQKVRLFGQRRVRSRIRIYLMDALRPGETELKLSMNRTQLADYLGVERTALARELSRMQKDGLIALDKRHVRILRPDYFTSAL